MNWQTILDPQLSGRLCLVLLHSLWQVALLAAIAWVMDHVWRRKSAQWSYALHTAALVLGLAALPITLAVVRVSTPAAIAVNMAPIPLAPADPTDAELPLPPATTAVGAEAPPAGQQPAIPLAPQVENVAVVEPATAAGVESWLPWAPWLAAIYIAGVVLMLMRLAIDVVRAERLRGRARPITDTALVRSLEALSRRWRLRVVPVLAQAERIVVPRVVGIVKPTVLLPAAALSGLSTGELEMILAHELAHVRRYDMWVNLLQRLAEAVLFFNPALWYLSRRISTLREYCCDELTCGMASASDELPCLRYATALVKIVELARTESNPLGNLTALAASGRSPSELRRRLARLFGEPLREPMRLSRGGLWAIAAVVALWSAGITIHPTSSDAADPRDNQARYDELIRRLNEQCTAVYETYDESGKQRTLSKLDLWGASPAALRTLKEQELDELEELEFVGSDLRTKDFSAIATLRSLKRLSVDNCQFLPTQLAALKNLTDLEALDLMFTVIDGPSETRQQLLGDLSAEEQDRQEELKAKLGAAENNLIQAALLTDRFMPNLSNLVRLKSLRFSNTSVTSAGLAHLKNLTELETLDVGVLDFTSDTATSLQGMKKLRSLRYFNVDDEAVAALSKLTSLEELDVWSGKVTGASAEHLAALTKLQRLEIRGNQLTDDELQELSRLPRLKHLDLGYAKSITPAGVERFRKSKPDCEIEFHETANRRVAADEATFRSPVTDADRQIADAIEILTEGPNVEPNKVWARAIKYLVDHREEALPVVMATLDAEQRDHPISKLAFALRAIGDRRAVPALIRALPRTLQPSRSDYGLRLEDPDLCLFMQTHDLAGRPRANTDMFDYGRAFREVVGALHRLTGQDFDDMQLNWIHLEGSASQQEQKRRLFRRQAERWADWWEVEWQSMVDDLQYSKVNLPPFDSGRVKWAAKHTPPAGPNVEFAKGHAEWIVQAVQESAVRCFVDLDTSREAAWPDSLPPLTEIGLDSPQLRAWAREQGIDMVGVTYTPPGETEPLYCLKPIDMHVWKITPDEHRNLARAMADEAPYPLTQPVELMIPQREVKRPYDYDFGGDSFLFVTREGTAGVIRMTAQATDTNWRTGVPSTRDDQFSPLGPFRGAKISFKTMTVSTIPEDTGGMGVAAAEQPSTGGAVAGSPQVIGDRFVVCPVTTDLQRSLLGEISAPDQDTSVCVLVNAEVFPAEGAIDEHAEGVDDLLLALFEYSLVDNREIRFHLKDSAEELPFEQVKARMKVLEEFVQKLGKDTGFARVRVIHSFGAGFIDGEKFTWAKYVERARARAGNNETDETPAVQSDLLRLTPVSTFLSNLLIDTDLVVEVLPIVRNANGHRFEADVLPAVAEAVRGLDSPGKNLLIRVRHSTHVEKELSNWTEERKHEEFANQLGLKRCGLSMTEVDEPESYFYVVPVTTELQSKLLNMDDVTAYLNVNAAGLLGADGTSFHPASDVFAAVEWALGELDPRARSGSLRVMIDFGALKVDDVYNPAKQRFTELAMEAGFTDSRVIGHWSNHDDYTWRPFRGAATRGTDSEPVVEVGGAKIYAVTTDFSRYLAGDVDCFIDVAGPVPLNAPGIFADDDLPAVRNALKAMELDSPKKARVNVMLAVSPEEFDDLVPQQQQNSSFQQDAVHLLHDLGFEDVIVQVQTGGTAAVSHYRQTIQDGDDSQPEPETGNPASVDGVQRIDMPIVVARHVLLLDGKEIITWRELENRIAAMPDPSAAIPHFYLTRGLMDAGGYDAAKEQIMHLHRTYQLTGHSEGSLWPRSDFRYDRIRAAADLVPDPELRMTGTVVDKDGNPVAESEVVLITRVDESISYKAYHMALVQGRVRNRLEHVMTLSDQSGQFELYPPPGEEYYVVAMHPETGFAMVRSEQFSKDQKLNVLAWAGLAAELADVPGETQSSSLSTRVEATDGLPEVVFNQYRSDLRDDPEAQNGPFTHIPPILRVTVNRSFEGEDGGSFSLSGASVSLLPGEQRQLGLGPLSAQQRAMLDFMRERMNRRRGTPPGETDDDDKAADEN